MCLIIGTTYTGEYEDVQAVNDLLIERNLDCYIHVDAASGGFVAPFVKPDLVWDFRLEKVVSINVSGHKYGLVYPGVGWVVWRDPEFLPKELIFNINYLGIRLFILSQTPRLLISIQEPIKLRSRSTSQRGLLKSLASITS